MVTGTVVVLGDIGRSPRMQYHCLSLASENVNVNVVAYGGKKCCEEVESNKNIRKYLIGENPFNKLPRKLFLLYAPFKVIYQILQLIILLLFKTPHPDFYLVQNPPSIPTLFIVWFVARLQGAHFFIDWHNFGYTIMGLSLRANHPLVRVAKWIERFFGRLSDGNLCVTQAMKTWLKQEWGIEASVLYDRAPSSFHRCTVQEQHDLFSRILPELDMDATTFTSQSGSEVHNQPSRPALLVSSTSWTPDEDFHILLDALCELDKLFSDKDRLRVVCIVTGEGPLKSYYQSLIHDLQLRHVLIKTIWLKYEDYPLLLGSADLGICLHTSSSGLDLPMKVVDMFGTGLPVCAASFHCLHELVKEGINGRIFSDQKQLASQLEELIFEYPSHCETLDRLRKGVEEFQKKRWEDNWRENAKPVLL